MAIGAQLLFRQKKRNCRGSPFSMCLHFYNKYGRTPITSPLSFPF